MEILCFVVLYINKETPLHASSANPNRPAASLTRPFVRGEFTIGSAYGRLVVEKIKNT